MIRNIQSSLLLAIVIGFPFAANAQQRVDPNSPAGRARDIAYQQQAARDLIEASNKFIPQDPWRIINGKTNYAKGAGWVHFRGEVVAVHPNGIRVDGWYGNKFDPHESGGDFKTDFYVKRFPYNASEGTILRLDGDYVAARAGTYTYTTIAGARRTIRQLDYGEVIVPPAFALDRLKAIEHAGKAAAQAAADKRATNAATAALKYHQGLAESGDPYGLLRMGERYLTGYGVEKDEAKARAYLSKSAALGNEDAQKLLEKMSPQPAP